MLIKERELTPLVLNPPPNIVLVLDADGVEKLLNFLETTHDFGFDIETTPDKDFWFRRVRTIQFGNSDIQYVIDLKAFCDNSSDLLRDCQGEYGKHLYIVPKLEQLLQNLQKYLCSDKFIKTGTNLGFEYMCFYWPFGMRIYGLYDCMMAEKCIYAGLGGKASLKNYDYYSMESMTERYFGKTIDKTLQTSFNLEDNLSTAQLEYAGLDTRLPLAIKYMQNLIADGETPKTLREKGKHKIADYLDYLDNLIFGDNLHDVIEIENNCIGSFIDMHLHGERIDTAKWLARVQKSKDKLVINLQELDKIFLPIVGSKNEAVDDEYIAQLELEWKTVRDTPTDEEINLKLEISKLTKVIKKLVGIDTSDEQLKVAELQIKLSQIEQTRKDYKEQLKSKASELKKKRTKINKLKESCEGEALINYGSDAQLLHCLKDNFKPLAKLENMDDETLEKFEHIPVMKLIREYHGLSKEIGTYGDSWAIQWKTHPCKEEGWLHPMDGKLHSTFNQYDADTGRSSSEKPNGQNLPQDKEVRECFIVDLPNEDIRISNCCNSETVKQEMFEGFESEPWYACKSCGKHCKLEQTHAEEYDYVVSDMSGAELRIMADDSGDEQWIGAFERGEDLHSAGTELLYPDEWLKETLPGCLYYIEHDSDSIKKYPKAILGQPKKEKCKCPGHKERRDDNKNCNFLLAYGGGPATLAKNIKKPLKVAKHLMALHELKNPGIWKYLIESGKTAARDFKAFDLYGRRRILPEPTHARARENCKEYNEKFLRLPEEDCQRNIDTFVKIKGKRPLKDEEFELTHRQPTASEIGRSYYQMSNSIERQGKNMRIQGTNASIIKIAMAQLFHILPKYRAKLVKMVHDELVIQSPKQYSKKVAEIVGEEFAKSAAIKMHRVKMEFDFHIGPCWEK